MKFVVLFLLLLLNTGNITAADRYEGTWFVTFNDMARLYRGEKCRLKIERQPDGSYKLTHLLDYCSENMPEEGSYKTAADGKLIKGTTTIWISKEGKLYSNKNRKMTLISQEMFENYGTTFSEGALLIDSAVTDSLHRPQYVNAAMHIFKDMVTRQDDCVECYYNIAVCWLLRKDPDSAAIAYFTAYRLDSLYEPLKEVKTSALEHYNYQCWARFGSKGDYAGAISYARRALKLDPNNADVLYNIGGASYSAGRYADAIKAFKKVLSIDPAYANAQEGLEAAQEALKEAKNSK